MDFKQIRYFVSVAEAGSFSAGARRAFVTQPTLSAAIAALEAELGFPLLERHARGVRLTPRGEEVLETARSILRKAEQLKAASGSKPSGRPLRLGILPTIAPAFVARCIAQLRAIEPGRPWRTEDAPLPKLRERLANGRYDVVLTALGSAARGHRQSELAADRQALAVSARTFPRGPVSPEILAGQPLIVRVHCEQLQSASRILDAWKVRPQVVAQTDSDARALAMVA
ncbi:MAG TPA: LysR family transcriptional regulator, partial [Xanthobacteraceae bacterium]